MSCWVTDFLLRNPDLAGRPIVQRAKRALVFDMGGGLRCGQFTGAPCHYDAGGGNWQPLDTALQYNTSDDEYGAPGLATRIQKGGRVRILDATGQPIHTQQTTRIGLYRIDTGAFTAMRTLGAGLVNGDSIIREAAQFSHALRLTETGLCETLTINTVPDTLPAGRLACIETAVGTTQLWPNGILDDAQVGAYRFPPPAAVDAAGHEATAVRYARYAGGVQYLYTGMPTEWFATAQYPVVLDPDYTGDTVDGSVYGQEATYAAAHLNGLYKSIAATTYNLGQSLNATYRVYRDFLRFDTAAIGAGATVTQVNLKLVCTTDNSSTDFDVQIIKENWSAQDPLTDANCDAAFDACLAATADDAIWRNTLGMSINTQYTSGNLATTWVNKVGYTYYGLLSSRDKANTAPTGYEVVALAAAEHGTAGYRPVLTVLWTAAVNSLGPSASFAYDSTRTLGRLEVGWVADTLGAVTLRLDSIPHKPPRGRPYQLVTGPSLTAAPTANYDVTLEDEMANDVLQAAGANRSATAVELAWPYIAGSLEVPVRPVTIGTLTFRVANAGAGGAGRSVVYFALRRQDWF